MFDQTKLTQLVKRNPDRLYLIHYSSQSLFDEGIQGYSPRITSIVVMHFATRQTVSFAIHAVAESLKVPRDDVEAHYDAIERELLGRFFDFMRDRREKYWIHWNMRNLTYGFEHLEQRYRVLHAKEPPHIPVEVRINLSDLLKQRYGSDYASDPKMKNLMLLNGDLHKDFLDGAQEAEAFKRKEFIRMHSSTICKVEFFRHVLMVVDQGRLHTQGNRLSYRIDRLLDARSSRIIAFFSAAIGIPLGIYQIVIWII